MSYTSFPRVMPVLSSEQIVMIAQIFERVCDDCDEPKTSLTAARCAATLIRSYQRGIFEEDLLVDIGHAVLRS